MKSLVVASLLAALALPAPASSEEAAPGGQPPRSPSPPSSPPSSPPPAGAQDEESRKKLEEDIAKALGAPGAKPQGTASPDAAGGAPPAQGQAQGQGATGGNPMARVLLLPDISAIGSFAGALDTYDVDRRSPRSGPFGPRDKPTPLFQELELGLQSVIDPYARADVFISFGPGGADVEEAVLTSLTLPAGLQLRAGKFFSPLGRQNQQHPHVWEFVDAPLARERLVASDVLSGPGLDVAWLTPLPWFAELHLAGQGTAPSPNAEDPGERLTAVARLLQYFSLGEATTLGVGLSGARRGEATGAFRDVGALDVYLKIRPPRTRAYLALQAEGFARRFRIGGLSEPLAGELPGLTAAAARGTETGGYAQLFWRQDAYYGYGVRYDDAPSAGDAAPGRERRYGAVATWFPSEFSRLRLQLSYDTRPARQDGLEALLALEFAIGAHGAHPY
jgi:hypothetical protein